MTNSDKLQSNQDYSDLYEFLEYINLKWLPKNTNNISLFLKMNIDKYKNKQFENASLLIEDNSIKAFEKSFYENLPVALVQLLILLLVFLIFIFMCKCNKIMESCRNTNEKKSQNYEDDQFNDKMKIKDYFCYLWYNFKLKHFTRRRRKRRFRNRNRAFAGNNANNHLHHLNRGNLSDEKRRNDSLIFRRRSVIYRNSRSNRNPRQKNLNAVKNSLISSNLENIIENPTKSNNNIVNDNNINNMTSIQTINEIKNISKVILDQFQESTIL